MKENVYMPRMGQTMTEGTVIKWLKNDGESVKAGDGIVDIMTDKVTTTIESPKDGYLQIIITEDNIVPVGTVIGEIIDE
jgi:pyruvate/2-oxoglutarate dehydrogenase complex dihydrolipoamide acyltransferase (E2) component